MKKKFLAVFASLFVFGSVSTFAFDWSQCWCNYGGGIEKGDMILHVDVGLGDWVLYNGLYNYYYDNWWSAPYVEIGLNYAGFIWKLPFTFGGYVGFDGYGYKNAYDNPRSYLNLYTGGDIAYHIQLPPEIMDLYVGTRIGAKIYLGDWNHDYYGWGYVTFDPYTGINFFFSKGFGLNVEAGGVNWLRAGLSFKF